MRNFLRRELVIEPKAQKEAIGDADFVQSALQRVPKLRLAHEKLGADRPRRRQFIYLDVLGDEVLQAPAHSALIPRRSSVVPAVAAAVEIEAQPPADNH